jgi:hypothetical protein
MKVVGHCYQANERRDAANGDKDGAATICVSGCIWVGSLREVRGIVFVARVLVSVNANIYQYTTIS